MPNDDKTEKATAKRRRESRQKGQVAKSSDLNSAAVLGLGLIMVLTIGGTLVGQAAGAMRDIFALIAHPGEVRSAAGLNGLVGVARATLLATVVPVAAGCLFAALLANIAQVGVRPSFKVLKPDFKRINPISGAKNVFGPRIAFETAKALAKVGVVGAVVAAALIPQLTRPAAMVGTAPAALGQLMAASARGIVERAVAAYVVIAIVDYAWQRKRHDKQQKMTKQEVKDEHKQLSLPPEVRAALRPRQIQAARARMMAAIPQADVVVTNPTHYAVALAYDGSRPAPVVVAKGQDLVAAQMRRIAEEHRVPVVPDAPLARSLHAAVEIDQMIPVELYAVVAQLLAFVYRMAGQRRQGAPA